MDLTGVVTDPIDAFHELLSTLSGALDVRDVFQRLSTVVARIVAHDEANLALRTEDGAHFRLYASTQEGEPELLCPDEHSALCDPLNARLFHDGYGSERGFRSGLQVPVRVDGKPIGGLMLLSHRPAPRRASCRLRGDCGVPPAIGGGWPSSGSRARSRSEP